MRRNRNGITLLALVITIIILVILAGVAISYAVGDNGIIANAVRIELETSKGEIRDHLLLILNDELLSCSADIVGTANDISTRYNEIRLINFLAGNKNYSAESGHEDISAVLCIEHFEGAVKLNPRNGKNISEVSENDAKRLTTGGEEITGLNLVFVDGDNTYIYNKYKIIPTALSKEVDSYGKGTTNDIFLLESVDENGNLINTEGADSTGKFQLNYYDKNGNKTSIETISLYLTNQS